MAWDIAADTLATDALTTASPPCGCWLLQQNYCELSWREIVPGWLLGFALPQLHQADVLHALLAVQ
jgi:hypothetical protein